MTTNATINAILTDIEGTTTDIDFVHKVLFPYARTHLPEYVRSHAQEPQVQAILEQVREETGASEQSLEEAIAQLLAWIDSDTKATPLKTLQGLIWVQGYESGDFSGHIYPDAKAGLERWQQQGLKLFVFSSGSVKAQKLIFGHSDFGDLCPLFSGYFDTTTGHKREADSYRKISAAMGENASNILFLSDIVEELDAAQAAGMQTCLLVRGAQPDNPAQHPQAATFDEINPGSQP